MQSASRTWTMPSSRWKLAPVGQTRTQLGWSQWWHCSGSKEARRRGKAPLRSALIQLRNTPRGTSFSALQATTQALQSMHFLESRTIA